MPLFGKKKQEEPPISKIQAKQLKEYKLNGPTSGLRFCNLKGKETLVASSLSAKKVSAMTPDGETLWSFTAGSPVLSLTTATFSGSNVVLAGSGGEVIAISETGKELWRYQMPEGSGISAGLWNLGTPARDSALNQLGTENVFFVTAGKLNGDDAIAAIARGSHMTEGPQIISSEGQLKSALKTKSLGMSRPVAIALSLLDFSPNGDAILGMEYHKAFGRVSVITEEGKSIKDFKVHIEEARDSGSPLPFKDKIRGRIVAGKFGGKNVFVIGTPYHISVAAVSLDGLQLWNYFTTRAKGPSSGVNDIQIGSLAGKLIVAVGCSDGSFHLVDEAGRRLDSWGYKYPVTNVACGIIGAKDAIAVGLYSGEIFAYTIELAG